MENDSDGRNYRVSTQFCHSLFLLISKVFRINVLVIENRMSMLIKLNNKSLT
jgi:hypothetical protein